MEGSAPPDPSKRKKEIAFVAAMAVIAVAVFFYTQDKNTLFSELIAPIKPVEWDDVFEREIVKSVIPITIMEESGNTCTVKAERFATIIDHVYFVKGEQLAKELNFDRENETLTLSCDKLAGDTSELKIWYVTKESAKHPTKYQYWISSWNNTAGVSAPADESDAGQ